MCLPAIRALKTIRQDSEIVVVTKSYLHDVFLNIPEISNIWTIPNSSGVRGIFNVARKLSDVDGDAGILFTNSFHSALLFKLAKIPNVLGYKKDLRGFLLNTSIPFPRNERHHIFFYLDLIEAFTGEAIGQPPTHSLVITEQELHETRSLLQSLGVDVERPMLAVSPSAAYGTAKQWEPSSFAQLIDRLNTLHPNLQILFFGSQQERRKVSSICSQAVGSVFNLAGELSLRESMVSISLCDCFLGNDSGLLHIASAVEVPYVGIFGPTIPHKTAPVATHSKVLYRKADCAPCNVRDCPTDHRCMKAITVDEVFEAVVSILPEK
jgi:heptosyltransferase-2